MSLLACVSVIKHSLWNSRGSLLVKTGECVMPCWQCIMSSQQQDSWSQNRKMCCVNYTVFWWLKVTSPELRISVKTSVNIEAGGVGPKTNTSVLYRWRVPDAPPSLFLSRHWCSTAVSAVSQYHASGWRQSDEDHRQFTACHTCCRLFCSLTIEKRKVGFSLFCITNYNLKLQCVEFSDI